MELTKSLGLSRRQVLILPHNALTGGVHKIDHSRQREGENPGGGQGPPISLPFHQPHGKGLAARRLLRVPHAAKTLYIYKHPCLLRDSNPVPTAPMSASLTTIPVVPRMPWKPSVDRHK
ncbi:hypothetical protein TNCV_3807521 [Trichonephila clavipes]|nr:hypothetical protein TNCV_3807521 [Trichonephila clavipes]